MTSSPGHSSALRLLPQHLEPWNGMASAVINERCQEESAKGLPSFAANVIGKAFSQSTVALVADRLVTYVEEHPDWTQTGFAKMIAINRSNLSHWREGQRTPSGDKLLMALLAIRSGLPDIGLSLDQAVYEIAVRTMRRIRLDFLKDDLTELTRAQFQAVHLFARDETAPRLYDSNFGLERTKLAEQVFRKITVQVRKWMADDPSVKDLRATPTVTHQARSQKEASKDAKGTADRGHQLAGNLLGVSHRTPSCEVGLFR